VANTLNLFRNGAVGFIGWLGVGVCDFAHQRQLVTVGIYELSQPNFPLRRAADNVRRRFELDAVLSQESMDRVDIRNAKVNLRTSLRLLAFRGYSNQQARGAAPKEGHLRWCGEKHWQSKNVAVEGDATLKVCHRDEKLTDVSVGKIHFVGWARFGNIG